MIERLLEHRDFIILNKPAGVITENIPRLLHSRRVQAHSGSGSGATPGVARFYLVHRLDKDTSGVLLLAKTEEVKDVLQQLFKLRKVKKTYIALVLGKIEPRVGEWADRLYRGTKGVFTVGVTGRIAKLIYRTVGNYKYQISNIKLIDLTLLEIELVTGRTHQIRVQAKAHGYPIIGDPLYRTKLSRDVGQALGLGRQFLHAKKIEFPWQDKLIRVASPLPSDLQAVLGRLR